MTVQNERTQCPHRCVWGWFHKLLMLVVLLAVGADTWGQTGPRPGETDPLGKPSRYNLFPDHELLAVLAHDPATAGLNAEFSFNSFAPSADLKTLTPLGGATNLALDLSAAHMGAAAGRILASDRDQVVYARRTTGSNLAVAFLGYPNSTTTLSPLANKVSGTADLFAIAVGDLDKSADADGNNHDEVVVCFATSPNNDVEVAVLDYTAPTPAPSDAVRPQATTTAIVSTLKLNNVLLVDAVLACTIGDFDGDGQNEIAVVGVSDGLLWVNLLRYSITDPEKPALRLASGVGFQIDLELVGSVDVTAGDFNGDGRDELAVSFVTRKLTGIGRPCTPSGHTSCHTYFATVLVVKAKGGDEDLDLNAGGGYQMAASVDIQDGSARLSLVGAQVVSGLFKFDPGNGFGFDRRQLALAANFNNVDGPFLKIAALSVSNDLNTVSLIGSEMSLSYPSNNTLTSHVSLVAGGFTGNGDIKNPLWSLALGTWVVPSIFDLRVLKIGASGPSVAFAKRYTQPVLGEFGRFPLVAYDTDGDSVYLGAPVHFTVSNMIRPQVIFQEPPKHTAYLGGQVVNVSRLHDFYVELKDSRGTTFASTTTDTTDWNIGGSLDISAKTSVEVGDIEKTGAKGTIEGSLKIGYDYDGHKEDYNSGYASNTLTFTGQTVTDDLLVAQLQTFDVWRYRAFGISPTGAQGQPLNGFYELVLPGPKVEARGGGLNFDWYQPLHENGNILSYPPLVNKTFTPSDLGSFTLPNGEKKTEPLVPATLLAFDGTSGTIQLDFSKTSGSGSQRESSHTLAENLDVKASVEASTELLIAKTKSEGSVAVNVHNSNSWSQLKTSDNETNTSTGITLNKPGGSATRAYNFAPVFYFAQDGTVKVVHAVDVLGNAAGRSFWASTYGQKPDPALNLPLRFEPDLTPFSSTWLVNPLNSRKKIRGFFLRKADLNPVTKDYDYLASAPTEGDKVRIEVRVYNYSTAQPADNVLVRFQAVGYNDATDTEVPFSSCPNGTVVSNGRCTIGETFVSLNPLAMRPVAITWDTSAFGPLSVKGAKEYRIYVVLDPDHTIDEIYEDDSVGGDKCSDPTRPGSTIVCNPGQNNEGYGTITIVRAPVLLAAQQVAQAEVTTPAPHADVRLRKDALAAIDAKRGTLFTDAVDAYLNRPLRIRVHVVTDVSDAQQYHLLLYKGKPKQEAEVIADKLLQGVDAEDGKYVWVEWTPSELGTVTLQAQVLEQEDDVIPGNGKRVLKVRVRPAPKGM
jgi:hypothetical protein